MKLTYHGHSFFEIAGKSGTILIDPFITGNAQASHIKAADFKDVTAILVTHGHGDHFGDTLEISQNTGALVIGVAELAKYCAKMGAASHRMHIGGKYQFPFGTVKLTQAIHGSAFDVNGQSIYAGLACGFIIQMDGLCLYHAGDTGLFGDMELIGRFNPIDLAMIPIGDNYVMGPEDAAYACKLLKAKQVIPMHYNTFPEIRQDVNEFIQLLKKESPDTNALPLQPGQSMSL
ncbi:MAG: metal-dependent hydrolase [Peptococcaceae bacterium]|nr:metal-dependent hydrolase [Peptococcaceae bacterium]